MRERARTSKKQSIYKRYFQRELDINKMLNNNKRALVLGAGGFIGSHMVKRLKKEGYWVRGVDLKHPEFSETEADDFIKGDSNDLEVVISALTDKNYFFDEIYQFAADMGGAGFIFTGDNDANIMHNSCMINLNILKQLNNIKGKERVSTGLLDYPVLMAGDILLYDADEVPVGEDQKQHVELSRDIAERFNRLYGETFKIPQPIIPEIGGRVMGLNDPNVKMSKSFSDIRGHAIRILDDPKEIERSFMRAVTDSSNEIVFSNSPEKAGVNNMLGIYKVITEKSEKEVEKDFASARGYGDLKKAVAEVVIEELRPIREKYLDLIQDVSELDRLLSVGAQQASSISTPKLDQMKDKMGLILPISKELY